MFRDRKMFLALAGLTTLLLLAGCSSDDDDNTAQTDDESLGFVGTVEGTNAFVSIMVADSDTETDEAIVYICDGDTELREWFRGPVDDPTNFALTNDTGATVTVTTVDGAFTGEFTDATGSTHAFETEEATGDAGLYEIDDPDAAADGIWAAWVVDNNGNQRGAFLRSGTFQPTPRLSSTTFRLSRFSIKSGFIEMNGIIAPNN